jgi:putative DNA methylase
MTYKKKLIEVALPLASISDAGSREQSIKRGKPTQLHKWFAARPMMTCRAVIWCSMVDDPSSRPEEFPTKELQDEERERLFELLREMIEWENLNNEEVLIRAYKEIEKSFPNGVPCLLDPFGGGATIPLEAQCLGLEARTGDLNPIPVLMQRAMLEIPQAFINRTAINPDSRSLSGVNRGLSNLAEDFDYYGSLIRETLGKKFRGIYPSVLSEDNEEKSVIAWIWARAVRSPDPSFSGTVPLVTSWVLSEKNGLTTWVKPVCNFETGQIDYQIVVGGSPLDGTIKRGVGTCVATGAAIPAEYIKHEAQQGRLTEHLIAVVADGNPGRIYLEASDEQNKALELIDTPAWKPSAPMSSHPQYMAPPRYGLDDWWKLFTPRQLFSSVALADAVKESWVTIESDALRAGFDASGTRLRDGGRGAAAYADAIVTYLSFATHRVLDWNNSLCGWDDKNTVNQQLFRRQAISMSWDFCEINPFEFGAGSLGASIKTLRTAIESLPQHPRPIAAVAQRDAAARVAEFDGAVVSTDPPYYDVVPYADLSDFFYVWARYQLKDIWPDELATLSSPKAEELVADSKRHGSKEAAKTFFEDGMTVFMKSVAEHQTNEAPATIFYAYKATERSNDGLGVSSGWDTFLQAIVNAGLVITATWPVRTENKTRLRAMNSNALATSVVLACRKRDPEAPIGTRGELIAALKSELPEAVKLLMAQEIPAVDISQSVMGLGMRVFSRYSKILESDGNAMSVRAALSLIDESLTSLQYGENADLDSYTRFAVEWYKDHGFTRGRYEDAETLANGKNVSVEGVVQAGFFSMGQGHAQLIPRNSLDDRWDPTTDSRLTVWETTQYLISALLESELRAAQLLRRIGGGLGEQSRQLAYLLYQIANQNRWSEEAGAYNMLVTAWSEMERLSRQELSVDSSPETLF